ncbi:hypothetical protein [Mumia zhuanghuii]|uniref:Uncharacterized protein n=1 Tax=Mumia zhuanghuii TaxID=2585211 RepID=A0A5C4MAT9_9ACTN|nr:hypothetical protein [Mumia zhuanghuii]TNC33109.1 hypothetical protein FHE65_29530 [Mumia zhuanghuii]TNC44261.1 hypothetical protein FHE65_16760 [Mumia zhuanghuii]
MSIELPASSREDALRGYPRRILVAGAVGLVVQIALAAAMGSVAPAWMASTKAVWLSLVPLALTLVALGLFRWALTHRPEASREVSGRPVCLVAAVTTAGVAACTGAVPAGLLGAAALAVTGWAVPGRTLKRDVQRLTLLIVSALLSVLTVLGGVALWRLLLGQDRVDVDVLPYADMSWPYWVLWGLAALAAASALVGYLLMVWRVRDALHHVSGLKMVVAMLGVTVALFTGPGAFVALPLAVVVLAWPQVAPGERVGRIDWWAADDGAAVDQELARRRVAV